jgi:DNA-directed RNA polymerases I, II, and III subunit RPABC2
MAKNIITDDFDDIMRKYDPSSNKTRNILSKFEKVKIIGLRSEQLQRGAQPYVKLEPNQPFVPRDVALQELKEHKLPFMLRRQLPNGNIEYFRLDDMIVL